jgi:uncharacterized integral membrane protein
MRYSSEDRPASTPGAAEPPMPKLPADLAPPAPPSGLSSASPSSGSSEPPSSVEPAHYEPSEVEPVDEPRAIDTPVAEQEKVRLGRTRTSAVWFGVWAGVFGVILLIIFVAQNTASVEINFLWLSGSISLALALLIAGVAGAAVAMGVAAARIIQLRRMFRRSR